MTWPPRVGDPLPRAEDAYNIREKLASYVLNLDHSVGGPKARLLGLLLDIQPSDVDYLHTAIAVGAMLHPIVAVRLNPPWGVNVNVLVPVRGLRARSDRTANIRTAWALRHAEDCPRLVTAFIDQ